MIEIRWIEYVLVSERYTISVDFLFISEVNVDFKTSQTIDMNVWHFSNFIIVFIVWTGVFLPRIRYQLVDDWNASVCTQPHTHTWLLCLNNLLQMKYLTTDLNLNLNLNLSWCFFFFKSFDRPFEIIRNTYLIINVFNEKYKCIRVQFDVAWWSSIGSFMNCSKHTCFGVWMVTLITTFDESIMTFVNYTTTTNI